MEFFHKFYSEKISNLCVSIITRKYIARRLLIINIDNYNMLFQKFIDLINLLTFFIKLLKFFFLNFKKHIWIILCIFILRYLS